MRKISVSVSSATKVSCPSDSVLRIYPSRWTPAAVPARPRRRTRRCRPERNPRLYRHEGSEVGRAGAAAVSREVGRLR